MYEINWMFALFIPWLKLFNVSKHFHLSGSVLFNYVFHVVWPSSLLKIYRSNKKDVSIASQADHSKATNHQKEHEPFCCKTTANSLEVLVCFIISWNESFCIRFEICIDRNKNKFKNGLTKKCTNLELLNWYGKLSVKDESNCNSLDWWQPVKKW